MDTHTLVQTNWHSGQLLAFSGVDGQTSYNSGVVATTSHATPGIEIKLPTRMTIKFGLKHHHTLIASDYFEVTGTDPDGQTQVIHGGFVDAFHLLIQGPMLNVTEHADSANMLTWCREGDRILIGTTSHWQPELIRTPLPDMRQQRLAWFKKLDIPAKGNDLRRRAVARALCVMKTQVMRPEGSITHSWTTPDRWPHRCMWLWDSAFHAIGWRHVNPQLAREMIEAVLSQQSDDGFIPHMAYPGWQSKITQPPVLCLASWLLRDFNTDTSWYSRIYPALASYVQWDIHNRDTDGDGLVEWYIEQDANCRSGESGMDNSTRFDSARQLGAVDFNSFLALECELLADMAKWLGYKDDTQHWKKQNQRFCTLIRENLYNTQTGFFHDIDTARNQLTPVMACSGFLPLICQAAQTEQINSLRSHLQNPQTFGTGFPVASVAAPEHERSTDMWRGPTWINMNWLIAYGLERNGCTAEAAALRRQTIEEIERWFDHHGTFFEYYDERGEQSPIELMRKGKSMPADHPDPFPHQAIRDYGWTCTLYLDMVLNDANG